MSEVATLAKAAHLADPAAFAEQLSQTQTEAGVREPVWRRRPHLELVSRRLVDATFGRCARLIVLVPRQTGKTSLVGKWFPAWVHELHAWGILDSAEVIHATYSDDYGRTWGLRTRRVIENNAERLRARVSSDSFAAGRWETHAGGVHVAGGLGGTGRTSRILIIDDPIRVEDIDSPAVRDRAWEWWLGTVGPTLAPGAAVVVVSTRYHDDDFVGRLLSPDREGDPDQWTTVRLPAVADDRDDPLGRAIGEPLYRPDMPADRELALDYWRSMRAQWGEHVWLGQYQQSPTAPKGTIFLRDGWAYWRPGDIPDGARQVTSVDCAFKSSDDSSFVVVQVWAYERGVEPRRWLVDQVRARMDFRQTKLAIRAAAEIWPSAAPRIVEPKANGPAVVNDLKALVAGLVDSFDATKRGSKEARAWAVQGEQPRVHLPAPGTEQPKMMARLRSLCEAEGVAVPDSLHADWVGGFVDELAGFPGGRHDDQVDALSQALLWMREFSVDASMTLPSVRIQ